MNKKYFDDRGIVKFVMLLDTGTENFQRQSRKTIYSIYTDSYGVDDAVSDFFKRNAWLNPDRIEVYFVPHTIPVDVK